MNTYTLAMRFMGLGELEGNANNGFIQWAHSLCGLDPDTPDETPWCSSFANAIAWILAKPRSGSAAARSWLDVGEPVSLADARLGDVVIFKRGKDPQPGPEVTRGAPGHVAFFAGMSGGDVLALGGNQGDKVSIARYPAASVIGVRRI